MLEGCWTMTVATVKGEEDTPVECAWDSGYKIVSGEDSAYVDAKDVTDVRDVFVIPLPEVKEVYGDLNMPTYLSAGDQAWSNAWPDTDLEAIVSRGVAAAAVLLHREEHRKPDPDLTEDLKAILASANVGCIPNVDAVRRVHIALAHGAHLVNGRAM